MILIADAGLLLFALLCAVPALTLLVQVLASLPAPRPRDLPNRRPPVAVLIPAHDEREHITAAVRGAREQLAGGDRLVVVADNCQDETAALAKAAGAEVVERCDPEHRGKGFALDAGLRFLDRTGMREVIVVVDADCSLHPGAVERLAAACAAENAPIQAAYLFTPALGGSAGHRIGTFAARVRTLARPLGARRLGMACPIMGSGFALPATCLPLVSLATGHLAEDGKLGLDLALAGVAPCYCPEARVESPLPVDEAVRRTQQTRWEHGQVALIRAYALRTLREAWRRRDPRLAGVALDLCVPPLVGLALVKGMVLLISAGWAGAGGGRGALLVASSSAVGLFAAVMLAAWRWGDGLVSWRDLPSLLRFVLAKLPILLGALTRPQAEWIRTGRTSKGT